MTSFSDKVKQNLILPVWIGIGVVVFVALQPFKEVVHLPVLFFLFAAIYLIFRRKISWTPCFTEYSILGGALIAPIVITSLSAEYPFRTFEIAVRWALYWMAGLYVLNRFKRESSFYWAIWGVTVLLAFVCLDALVQYFRGTSLLGLPYRGQRIESVFAGQLILGNSIAHWTPFALEAIRRFVDGRPRRYWAWLFILPIAAVCFVSANRSSWVVLAVVLGLYALYLMWTRQVRWYWVFGGLLLCLASLLAIVNFSDAFADRFSTTLGIFSGDYEAANAATANRLWVYQVSWAIIQDNWLFGVGWRGFDSASDAVGMPLYGIGHAHLYILDVWLQTGVLGLITYLVTLFLVARQMFRAFVRKDNLAFMLFVGAFALVMPINTHYSFYWYHSGAMMWVYLMLAYGAANSARPSYKKTPDTD